jgi:hypothetical protein
MNHAPFLVDARVVCISEDESKMSSDESCSKKEMLYREQAQDESAARHITGAARSQPEGE